MDDDSTFTISYSVSPKGLDQISPCGIGSREVLARAVAITEGLFVPESLGEIICNAPSEYCDWWDFIQHAKLCEIEVAFRQEIGLGLGHIPALAVYADWLEDQGRVDAANVRRRIQILERPWEVL